MANSRLSFTETRQILDNIAKSFQLMRAVVDGQFAGEATNTFLYAQRYLVETRLRALTSDRGIRDFQPAAESLLGILDTTDSAGSYRLLANYYGPMLRAIVAHHANYDTTYTSFWDWWNTNKAAASNDKVLGEVADLMVAAGINVDPDHCVPPANTKLSTIIFSGSATAAIATVNKLDPLRYKGHTCEIYCVARNAVPDEIVLSLNNAKDSSFAPGTAGTVDFPITILSTQAAGQVMDIPAVAGDTIFDTSDSTLTITSGGKTSDSFIVRVKEYRAAAV